jgi:hypothetical protein
LPNCVAGISFEASLSNPDEEHMGSTTFGNVNPASMTGLALPQDIKIKRAGSGRVRGDGGA